MCHTYSRNNIASLLFTVTWTTAECSAHYIWFLLSSRDLINKSHQRNNYPTLLMYRAIHWIPSLSSNLLSNANQHHILTFYSYILINAWVPGNQQYVYISNIFISQELASISIFMNKRHIACWRALCFKQVSSWQSLGRIHVTVTRSNRRDNIKLSHTHTHLNVKCQPHLLLCRCQAGCRGWDLRTMYYSD